MTMATTANPDLKKGMEDMKQHHAASLSAIHESGKTLHKGMTDIHQSISEHIADSFNSTMEAMKSMFSAKTPQEAASIHKEWLQGSVKIIWTKQHKFHKKQLPCLKKLLSLCMIYQSRRLKKLSNNKLSNPTSLSRLVSRGSLAVQTAGVFFCIIHANSLCYFNCLKPFFLLSAKLCIKLSNNRIK
jgi:hypothetical protein